MEILDMKQLNEEQLLQAAKILTASLPLGWPTFKSAMNELEARLLLENTLLAAVKNEEVIGWGGLLAPEYDGRVFELHPLAVREDQRGQGVGSKIVRSLEKAAKEQGGLTIYLGADDEENDGETSLSNIDLYTGLPQKMEGFEPGTHQSAFYLKLGYQLIGVMPDANGIGKPDLFFGKSLEDINE